MTYTTSAKMNQQYPEVSTWLMDAGATVVDNGANAQLLIKTMGYIKDTHVNTLMALRVQMLTAFAVMSIGIIAANIHIIVR